MHRQRLGGHVRRPHVHGEPVAGVLRRRARPACRGTGPAAPAGRRRWRRGRLPTVPAAPAPGTAARPRAAWRTGCRGRPPPRSRRSPGPDRLWCGPLGLLRPWGVLPLRRWSVPELRSMPLFNRIELEHGILEPGGLVSLTHEATARTGRSAVRRRAAAVRRRTRARRRLRPGPVRQRRVRRGRGGRLAVRGIRVHRRDVRRRAAAPRPAVGRLVQRNPVRRARRGRVLVDGRRGSAAACSPASRPSPACCGA